MNCTYPTEEDHCTLPIVWLTNDKVPWDPESLNEAETIIMPLYVPSTTRMVDNMHANMQDLMDEKLFKNKMRVHQTLTKAVRYYMGADLLTRICLALKTCMSKANSKDPDYEEYRSKLEWLPWTR